MPRSRITLNREQAELAARALAVMVTVALSVAPIEQITLDEIRAAVAAEGRIRAQLDVP